MTPSLVASFIADMPAATQIVFSTIVAQAALALLLGLALRALAVRDLRGDLRDWARSWAALSLSLITGALALLGAQLRWALVPRLALSTVSAIAGYWHLAFLAYGIVWIARGAQLTPAARRWATGAVLALALGTVLPLAFTPSAAVARLVLRVGVRAAITAGVFFAAAWVVWHRAPRPVVLGRSLLAGGLALYAVQQVQYCMTTLADLFWHRSAGYAIYLGYGDLVLHAIIGAGMLVWMLEVDRAALVEAAQARELAQEALRQRDHELRQAQRLEAVGRLAGGVAHDFNNLLTAIRSFADLALATLEPSHPAHDDVREVRSAADRAAALTRQLLAFSRRQVLRPRTLDVNALVHDTETMLARLIGADVTFGTALAATRAVRADPGQLEQVVMNLVVNARDAMPEGGTITLTSADVDFTGDVPAGAAILAPGRYVMLTVRDTGTGMDRETLSRIFEPFFTTKAPGRGTGLGLATVFGIVRQAGGDVTVDSALGAGTTFRVYLPAAPEGTAVTDEHPVALPEPAAGAPASPGDVVLVADDDPAVRRLVARALEGRGYRVLQAADGEEAIDRLADHAGPIHLVLTDLVMPRLGGRALIEHVRAARPEAAVLLMSGHADDRAVRDEVTAGELRFVEKPFTIDGLLAAVRDALAAPSGGAA